MAYVLQEVDSDTLSTILFDYSDSTGGNNIGGVQTWFGIGGVFGLGAPGVSIDTTDRQGDGIQEVTYSYDDVMQTTFSVRMKATSYDALRTAVGTLQRLLASEGVMRWIPNGSTQTYYVYRKPSNIPALFSGAELELYKAGSLLEGTLAITINRERLLRGPELLASVNHLNNPTLMMAHRAAASGVTYWDWDSTSGITEAGYGANVYWPNQSYRFTIATTGTRNFVQTTAAASAAPGDVWTMSVYARATGGSLCKARALIEFHKADTTLLATYTGTLTTLTSTDQRLTVTSVAAPATTDYMVVGIRFANTDTTVYTVDIRRGQLEKAAAATQFRVGPHVAYNYGTGLPNKSIFVWNPGDANSLARITLAPLAGAFTVAYNLARRSEGMDTNLSEAVNPMSSAASSFRTWQLVHGVTLYGGATGDTSSQADSDASDGNAAKTTFTNQASMVRRWRWVNTPTDPEALHGRWDVYGAIRPEVGVGTTTQYRVCLHWQAANRDPVINVEDEIAIDATDPASTVYTVMHLGTVEFNAAGDTSLVLEGWAAQDAGTGSLWWDVVYLVPADEQQTLVQVPGFRVGDQGREVWLGSELTAQPSGMVSGAAVSGTKVVLDTVNEGVGTPPSTTTTGGVVWAAGRHLAKATVDLRVPAGTAATSIGRLRIRKAPGPGVSVSAFATTHAYNVGDFVKPTVGNLNSRTYVVTTAGTSAGAEPSPWASSDGATQVSGGVTFTETTLATRFLTTKANFTSTRNTYVVALQTDGTTAYEAVVMAGTNITGVSGKIHILRLEHTTLRVVDDSYSVQMLGDAEVLETISQVGASIDDLVKQGPYISLGPGLNILWVDHWEIAPNGYDDMTDEPLGRHNPSIYTIVSVDVIPRYWS